MKKFKIGDRVKINWQTIKDNVEQYYYIKWHRLYSNITFTIDKVNDHINITTYLLDKDSMYYNYTYNELELISNDPNIICKRINK